MIIYSGPSELDGEPIVAIITGIKSKSNNSKTGDMPQIWILRSDIHPTEALRTGQDSSICGNCIHRPKKLGADALKKNSRTCYVNTMSFNGIFKSYKKGGYAVADLVKLASELEGRHVRVGAYGDPASLPIEILDTLLSKCKSTGYTHQWRTCDKRYAKYNMASCDTIVDVADAVKLGYRTFFVQPRVDYKDAIHNVGGIKLAHCPASKELGKVTTCRDCMMCDGTRFNHLANITIMLH